MEISFYIEVRRKPTLDNTNKKHIMTYTYNVTIEINRFDLSDASIHQLEIKTNKFSHSNPLTARNAAFDRSSSDDEVLVDSFPSTELFFQDTVNWHTEIRKKVTFVDPNTNKEIILHDNIFVDKKTRTYDELAFRQILNSLEMEYDLLEKNGIEILTAKNIEVTFLPSNEILKARVFPTQFIQDEKFNIQEIALD